MLAVRRRRLPGPKSYSEADRVSGGFQVHYYAVRHFLKSVVVAFIDHALNVAGEGKRARVQATNARSAEFSDKVPKFKNNIWARSRLLPSICVRLVFVAGEIGDLIRAEQDECITNVTVLLELLDNGQSLVGLPM